MEKVLSDVDEEFIAIVCEDEELLRAEFEAIIDASWADPPAPRPARRPARPPRPPRPTARDEDRPATDHHPLVRAWARQRSPPAGCADRPA